MHINGMSEWETIFTPLSTQKGKGAIRDYYEVMIVKWKVDSTMYARSGAA